MCAAGERGDMGGGKRRRADMGSGTGRRSLGGWPVTGDEIFPSLSGFARWMADGCTAGLATPWRTPERGRLAAWKRWNPSLSHPLSPCLAPFPQDDLGKEVRQRLRHLLTCASQRPLAVLQSWRLSRASPPSRLPGPLPSG